MAEVMLGKELHPDRVIPVEKLYEIFNEHGIPYRFATQHGIENNSFAVVRCKDCQQFEPTCPGYGYCYHWDYEPGMSPNEVEDDDFCSYGERRTDNV